jgi:mannose-6-phosphate isomerase-like protein (cupin superfamily)
MSTPGDAFGVPLPGGTSISHVRVYDWVGPDGLAGGTPHLHTACTEAYLVIAGEGAVQTLSSEGFAETPLMPGTVAWFSPGTVHRLVNGDGHLELYVVMSNAGLPEAGDLVIACGPSLLGDPDAYREIASLPDGAATERGDDGPARQRRDAGVEGFAHWRREVERVGGAAGLAPLHRAAAEFVGTAAGGWADLVGSDPAQEMARSEQMVSHLRDGDLDAATAGLADSAIRYVSLEQDCRAMGCCGTLGTVVGALDG